MRTGPGKHHADRRLDHPRSGPDARLTRLARRVAALGTAAPGVAAAKTPAMPGPRHVQVRFHQVNGSGVSGIADLREPRGGGGALIAVVAFGLKPGDQYLSLDYSNHVCQLEPYSVADVIGGIYTANAVGVGTTRGQAGDELANINSVSVRKADFTLVACADVHPGK